MTQPLYKAVWRFLKKLSIYLLDDPVIPHLGIYQKENIYTHRDLYMNVHGSTIHSSPEVESTQMSNNWWINKVCYNRTMKYYLSIKRNNMVDLRNIMLCESNQTHTHTHAHTLYNSIYIKCPQMAHVERQKLD